MQIKTSVDIFINKISEDIIKANTGKECLSTIEDKISDYENLLIDIVPHAQSILHSESSPLFFLCYVNNTTESDLGLTLDEKYEELRRLLQLVNDTFEVKYYL